LPKEAGLAMFAARITDGAPMLPEDRSATPVQSGPDQSVESPPVAPPPMQTGPEQGVESRPVAPPPAQTGPERSAESHPVAPPPVQIGPEQGVESRPVAPPSRRVAPPRAADSRAQSERGDPENDQDEDARDVAGARKARVYRANVRAHLAGNKPAGAYGSGRAVVAFNLSPDGRLRSVRISRSSGSPALDQAVLKTVRRAAPFPKPPKGLKPAQLRFLIPFEFR
jgi:periplasmic protein TonB